MKADKKSMESATVTAISDSTKVVQKESKGYNTIIINLLPVLAMIIAILPGMIHGTSGIEIAKIGIITLILTTAATFYIRSYADNILGKRFAKSIITACYLGSILLLMLIQHPEIYSFWMIGGLVVAMLIDNKLGLLFHFNLSFIVGIVLALRPEIVIQLLVIGVLMSLLSGYLKEKSTVIYAAIILLSTNITLAFVINNFVFEKVTNYNYLSTLFSILAVLATAFLFCLLYEQTVKSNHSLDMEELLEGSNTIDSGNPLMKPLIEPKNEGGFNQDFNTENILQTTDEVMVRTDTSEKSSETNPIQYHVKISTSYDLLNEVENELLIKLKQYSESLYRHSLRIGDISYRAAKVIGADDMLAKAGGLYHEIGKIKGKDYIEEGFKIAEEYSFSKELVAILKQHNIKYEKPTSVEAAIVMLTDNIISTIEYIEKTGDHKYTTNKIIDNIFQMRMDKGTFDDSGLTVKNFKQLKEFYQGELNTNTRP